MKTNNQKVPSAQTKSSKSPSTDQDSSTSIDIESSPDEKFKKQWKETAARLADLQKLIYDFYELHDTDVIDGSKKKKIPPRRDLQLQRQLYRQEATRLHNLRVKLIMSAYDENRRLRTELFED